MSDPIVFVGYIPNIQSALKFGDSECRAQFQIPASHLSEAVKLVGMQEKQLKITVEEL